MAQELNDTELTLSTGKLLGIFFALVVVCALFFSFGYTIGRGAREGQPVVTDSATLANPVQNPGPKPAAGRVAAAPVCDPADANCTPATADAAQAAQPSSSNELSFFKSANDTAKPDSNSAATTSSKPEAANSTAANSPDANAAAAHAAIGHNNTPDAASRPAPELTTGYMVQVAAVSKQEDADALVNALRKKQYPVLLVPNPQNSKLFHVQVGPFAELKDAEAMRSRLASDGYNAILKK